MVYDDAKKEFSLASMTGFGADGSRAEKEMDFEQWWHALSLLPPDFQRSAPRKSPAHLAQARFRRRCPASF